MVLNNLFKVLLQNAELQKILWKVTQSYHHYTQFQLPDLDSISSVLLSINYVESLVIFCQNCELFFIIVLVIPVYSPLGT